MSQAGHCGAGQVDFAKLYAELGVEPDCGLEAFKQAYRRRVAELHPDRPPATGRDPERLVTLNLGYAAALEFHRTQGRIPGAPLPAPAPAPPARAWSAAANPHHQARAAAGSAGMAAASSGGRAAVADRRAPRKRVLVLPVLLLVAAIWRWLPTFEKPPAEPAIAPIAARAASAQDDIHLQLGMDHDAVIALIGEPVSRSAGDAHWLYGPSWLRFECGRVSDWYSSPLRPLRVATRTPGDEDRARPGARIPPCAPPPRTALHDIHEDA